MLILREIWKRKNGLSNKFSVKFKICSPGRRPQKSCKVESTVENHGDEEKIANYVKHQGDEEYQRLLKQKIKDDPSRSLQVMKRHLTQSFNPKRVKFFHA